MMVLAKALGLILFHVAACDNQAIDEMSEFEGASVKPVGAQNGPAVLAVTSRGIPTRVRETTLKIRRPGGF